MEKEKESLGLSLTDDKDSYYVCRIGKRRDTDVVIPASYNGLPVTSIGDDAFKDCRSLTSITIPSSVTSIGDYAFYNCNNLTSITIPSSVTSIGDHAFGSCIRLTSIVVDSNNSVYDSRNNCNAIIETSTNTLISGCKNTIIPSSVTSIGNHAFHWCSCLTNITIPSSVTSIEDNAFDSCRSLKSITIPSSVTSIGDNAFENCSNLKSITIPSSVTSIGDCAFIWCSSLKSIVVDSNNRVYDSRNNCNAIIETSTNTLILGCKNSIIPSSVTSIGKGAFEGCRSLKNITVPSSVTSIGDHAFNYCSSLTSITIPSSVTSIGDAAFRECESLTSITLPSCVTSIGKGAFEECSSLTSITILSGVTSIGDYAFDVFSLTSINYAGTMKQWNSIYRTNLGIRSGVTVTCTDGTITINEFGLAMASCGGENDSSTSTNVATPSDGVGLEFKLSDGKDSYDVSSIGTCADTDVVIPASYKGLPVTSIGDGAFDGCRSLTNITVPSSVTSIENNAFIGCSSLTSITIPSSVRIIRNGAFGGCSSLTSLTIPSSVTSIGDFAFSVCSSLTSLTIPSSVTSIGDYAFNKCSSLTSINYAGTMKQWKNIYSTDLQIRSGVVVTCTDGTITINEFGLDMASCGGENDASTSTNVATPSTSTNVATPSDGVELEFELSDDNDSYNVSGIGTCTDTDVVIPASYDGLPVTSIGDYAFVLCSSLTRITLPSSVKSIGDYAFYNCKSLTSITIPFSVSSIGNGAFLGSSGLTSIHYAGTMEQWKNSYGTNLKIRSGVVVTCTDGTITIE